ncbi:MAG: hypothetical protein HYV01_24425 [Deltaproteobacteria bacterium]|nr:hypothetical protein [Deltaproteobacteria bacterium]
MTTMKNDELSYNLGDVVDRLISVQYFLSGGGSALTQKPVTGVLYEAAREKAGAPLSYLAARALADSVGRGDTVIITTGLIAPPYMVAEGDGREPWTWAWTRLRSSFAKRSWSRRWKLFARRRA